MSASESDNLSRLSLPGSRTSSLNLLIAGAVIVAALYLGREVLVPLALAVLLSFVLAPAVRLLQRWRFPRAVAVIVVGLFAFSAIFGLGALMISQITQLAGNLPTYRSTLSEKIRNVRGAAGGRGTLERASEVLQDLSKEIDKPQDKARAPPGGGVPTSRPIPVEIKQPDPGALQALGGLIAPLVTPLTTTGIVVIFVIFILIQQRDLRNRLVRLAGAHDLQRTTAALDDAGQRLSRLFLYQLALNSGFGLVIGAGLWFIGVPSAPLWGILALVMRFVPYIGAILSAVFPLVLAAAVGSDWTMVLLTAALFLVAEAVVGQLVEPLVAGHSTGLSPVAVVVSAAFWTWLWGPIGLILATPLTMCLVVLGRHIDQLKFLEVMLGDEPPLTPAQLIYQRMLAGDAVEAAEQARSILKEKPLAVYYDEVLLEGLRLAELDAERGLLDAPSMERIRDAVAEIIDDLAEHEDQEEDEERQEPANAAPLSKLEQAALNEKEDAGVAHGTGVKSVLCIPGPSLLDGAATALVAHLVERAGIGARAENAEALSMSRIFSWETKDVVLVCLCYLEYATPGKIRYAIRRVRRRLPNAAIVVALFGNAEPIEDDKPERAAFVQSSLHDVVEKIKHAQQCSIFKRGVDITEKAFLLLI